MLVPNTADSPYDNNEELAVFTVKCVWLLELRGPQSAPHNTTLMLTGGRREEAFTELTMDVCSSQVLLCLSESFSVATKLLKKENCSCGYSNCSVFTALVYTYTDYSSLVCVWAQSDHNQVNWLSRDHKVKETLRPFWLLKTKPLTLMESYFIWTCALPTLLFLIFCFLFVFFFLDGLLQD